MGGGPKSFIQLRELQTYQVGLSSSFKDVYGHYDAFGDLYKTDKSQTFTLAVGAGARLADDLDAFVTVPWVYQLKETVGKPGDATNLGDVIFGAKYVLLRSLFQDDWYPTISVTGGVKAPTGTVEKLSSEGKIIPGTGNGIWEPFLGIGIQKDYRFVILGFNATYTRRFQRTVADTNGAPLSVKEGDRVELSEILTFPLSRRFSVSGGSAQTWDFATRINGAAAADTSARMATIVLSASYFLNQYWSITAGSEVAVPIAKLGVNQEATRSITVTTTYSFY